ncbi:uncharacterized protein HGUI_04058 [Hanseniaspora guilliermondii]|uniref:Uncharacterized protein n=1 Tax=Hanseniaspora guilliermondii TaxID=56406 RepID=A0A1L0CTD9_9ASCO|nr:uncharacterized protein HGUI_04058 [Hanseniaspora guilliermondii]
MDKVFNQTFGQTHKDIEFPQGNLEVVYSTLDQPIGAGSQLKAKDVQEIPSVKVSSSLINKDALYTLIMSDIDASAEGCHYLVTNLHACSENEQMVVKNKTKDDEVILEYVPPGPRIEQNHAYVWLLFEGVPDASRANAVNECRRGYGTNEKYHGAEWFKEVSGLGQLLAFNYYYVKNDQA